MSSKRTPVDGQTFAAMMTAAPMKRKPTENQLAAMRRTAERLATGEEPIPHDEVVAAAREAASK